MKHTEEIIIERPRDEVVALFTDPDNLKEWQPGFVSITHLEGPPGQPGCKSRLLYDDGKRQVEMIETITVRDLPKTFGGTYETPGAMSIMSHNTFEVVDPGNTRWIAVSEMTFGNFMMKAMAVLMPGAFKKQTRTFMQKFKEFAEKTA